MKSIIEDKQVVKFFFAVGPTLPTVCRTFGCKCTVGIFLRCKFTVGIFLFCKCTVGIFLFCKNTVGIFLFCKYLSELWVLFRNHSIKKATELYIFDANLRIIALAKILHSMKTQWKVPYIAVSSYDWMKYLWFSFSTSTEKNHNKKWYCWD